MDWLLGLRNAMNRIAKTESELRKEKMDQASVLRLLRQKGYRITKQRENLIEVILEGNCTSCKEIYFKASKKDAGIGMATIYRMVNVLEEIGALEGKYQYSIREVQQPQLEACTVELEDHSRVQLHGRSIQKVFEKGMEVCGYTEGKRVKNITILEK